MKYYSTRKQSPFTSLKEAVIRGLAPDRGLYMPEFIPKIPKAFFNNVKDMSLQEMSFVVANAFFKDDIDAASLKDIVYDTLNFDIPLCRIGDSNIYSLELYYGPTMAFKDVGARFMARLLGYFNAMETEQSPINVLVATSGDTGGAVANGFYGVEGVRVFVLYPANKVSNIQESQFTTLGNNIFAIEVDGTFDDCQNLVKKAFLDYDLNDRMKLTSANSINIARLIPQSFYYFYAYAKCINNKNNNIVISVPSGNLGNLTAGLIAKKMGLPIKRFIAANNRNDVFFKYLTDGKFQPKPSVQTIANAMDVGNPSNFERIADLYAHSKSHICDDIKGYSYDDEIISETMRKCYMEEHYLLDPHGATAYKALTENLNRNECGIFLETAHPAKFKENVDAIIETDIPIPDKLVNFMKGIKCSIPLPNDFNALKILLLSTVN